MSYRVFWIPVMSIFDGSLKLWSLLKNKQHLKALGFVVSLSIECQFKDL